LGTVEDPSKWPYSLAAFHLAEAMGRGCVSIAGMGERGVHMSHKLISTKPGAKKSAKNRLWMKVNVALPGADWAWAPAICIVWPVLAALTAVSCLCNPKIAAK
jgi:hypothetical protein